MSKNVIFLITHDVGPVYGCYGNTQIHTPNIDALSRESVRFDNHYCQWPLCGPSRANLFTGCRPLTTRRFDNKPFFANFRKRAPEGFESLPEHFASAGWSSFATGWLYHDEVDPFSWQAGHHLPEENGGTLPEWARGWLDADSFFEWKSERSRELIRERLERVKQAGTSQEQFQTPAGVRAARGPAVESAEVRDEEYYDGKVTEQALDFLSRQEEGRPYFLGVGFVAPHTPFRAPAQYWNMYDRERLVLPENLEWPQGSEEWMAGDSEPAQYYTTDGYTKPWRANPGQLRELLHGHYATISYIDALIGRILAAAKARGDWGETLVVFTSDHGFSEGQHGYWGKHNMWDASLKVPLLLRVPGSDELPAAVSQITEHVDIYPTLCDLAGLATPRHCEGQSTLRLLSSDSANWKDRAVSHRKHMWHDRLQVYDLASSLRTDRYRYTEYLDAAGGIMGVELFDYLRDPLEKRNHAKDTGYAGVVSELSRKLRSAVREEARRAGAAD